MPDCPIIPQCCNSLYTYALPGCGSIPPDPPEPPPPFVPLTFNAPVHKVSLAIDGGPIVLGEFNLVDGVTQRGIAAMNLNGTAKTSYAFGAGFSSVNTNRYFNVLKVDGEGNIYMWYGNRQYKGSPNLSLNFFKVNTVGTIAWQTTFNGNSVFDLSLITSGGGYDIFLAGSAFNGSGKSVRVSSSTGQYDPSYSDLGVQAWACGLMGNGIFQLFDANPANPSIPQSALLRANGSSDPQYAPATQFNQRMNQGCGLIVTIRNTVIMFGNFSQFNGYACNGIVEINIDGSINTAGSASLNDMVQDGTKIESINYSAFDNSLVFVGTFTNFAGQVCNRIAKVDYRFSTAGIFNPTFTTNSGSSFNGDVYDAAIDASGFITCVGAFTEFNEVDQKYVCRLYADGNIIT